MPTSISSDGRDASVEFTILGPEDYPTLEIKLSGETYLEITGNKIKQPIVTPIKRP